MKKNYKYLFGPVSSRRLGRSLGVDLVPYKTCSMDCVYCESGKTTNLTLNCQEFYSTSEIIKELDDFLSTEPELDFVTFSGAGEPLLHSGIGDIIQFIKSKFPKYKTALLTNSMLLLDKKIVSSVLNVDMIVPSLDAAFDDIFNEINRPVSRVNCKELIDALRDFKHRSKAIFCLEILFIAGINDSDESLEALYEAVRIIKPDKLQINTLDRPGTENNISALTQDKLLKIAERFQSQGVVVEIPSRSNSDSKNVEHCELFDVVDKILALILRRPSTLKDISEALSCDKKIILEKLKILESERKIISEIKNNIKFYKIL